MTEAERLAEFWPNSPAPDTAQNTSQPSRLARALARGVQGVRQGFGGRPIGMPADFRARYPGLSLWQPLAAAPADVAMRSIPAAFGGLAGLAAGTAEALGMSEMNANRLQRELNVVADMTGARRSYSESSLPSSRALSRMASGFREGFGDRELGMPAEFRARYPGLSMWQPLVAAPADFAMRAWPGFLHGAAGFAAGLYEDAGGHESDANRLQRDINALTNVLGARRLGR